jgi:hypothetical protein
VIVSGVGFRLADSSLRVGAVSDPVSPARYPEGRRPRPESARPAERGRPPCDEGNAVLTDEILTAVAKAIQAVAPDAADARSGPKSGLSDADALRLARAAVAAYGESLAKARLAIVPLDLAQAMEHHDRATAQSRQQSEDDREAVEPRLARFRTPSGKRR